MGINLNQEELLEKRYQGVLTYTDAKQFLAKTPYTAPKINGAIKRFCNAESAVKPETFIEMEEFVNDLADFWLDANPEVHANGERILHAALSNYVAFSIVWKAKSKASNIINPDLMNQAGKMLIWKNTLGSAVKMVNSRLAHDKCPNKELYQDFRNILPEAFCIMLPIVQGLQNGSLTLPEGQTENDLHRLIGAFFARHPAVTMANESLKQIEHKEVA